VRNLPAVTDRLETAEPIYRAFPGWKQDTRGVLDRRDLPREALDYIDFLEQELDAGADLISSGPRREETVVSGGSRLEEWLGERLPAVRAARAVAARRAEPDTPWRRGIAPIDASLAVSAITHLSLCACRTSWSK